MLLKLNLPETVFIYGPRGEGVIYQSPPVCLDQRKLSQSAASAATPGCLLYTIIEENESIDKEKTPAIPVGLVIDFSDPWVRFCLQNLSLTRHFVSHLNFISIRNSASLPGDVSVLD